MTIAVANREKGGNPPRYEQPLNVVRVQKLLNF